MIPEGHTIEDIKKREQIIRDFYRELKEKSISNEMLNFCPLCVAEVYTLRCDVMRCGRGLRATHYIVQPRLTVYAGKICSFSLFTKPVLINFKKVYQNGYFIFKICHFV